MSEFGFHWIVLKILMIAYWAISKDWILDEIYYKIRIENSQWSRRGAIPPKHSVSLSMGSRFFDDRLVLGSRVSYQSNANAKKSKAECQGVVECWGDTTNSGTGSVVWKSYYTVDAYADYKPMPNLELSLIGTNLTNEYHPDALTRTIFPAPGRTFKLGLDYKF